MKPSLFRTFPIAVALLFAGASSAMAQYPFAPVWQTVPWGSGGLHPSSVVWSMVQSELDLDNDGKKEILVTTAWSGTYHNTVYLFESTGNNTFEIIWSYSFYPYSNDYSAVAVADLNGNGRKEILCLIDPADSTYHGFYVFEWDGTDNGFPLLPTTTWNLGLAGSYLEGTAIIAGDFDNDGRDEVAVTFIESTSPPRSRLMIFSLSPGSTFQNPQWVVEFADSTTFSTVGYALLATDLDLDGRKEIIAAGWEPLHVAVFEHAGIANSYARAADIPDINAQLDLLNMGFAEANFDGGANELYMVTANGGFYVVTNPGDVSQMTTANVTQLHQYNALFGAVGLSRGDIDNNGVPELYVAGSYHEAVFQWKYLGGPVVNSASYSHTVIFRDDTTDSITPGSDQGYLRPSKVAVGDFDSDGQPDMVIASASFAADKPVLIMVEQPPAFVRVLGGAPQDFVLEQNHPNPFNPSTSVTFSIARGNMTTLKVFDVLGREVTTLLDVELLPGTYTVHWNADGLTSGTYFYTLESGEFKQTKRMVLVK